MKNVQNEQKVIVFVKENFLKLLLAVMLSATVVMCLEPIEKAFLMRIGVYPSQVVVHADGGNDVNGSSELWIAAGEQSLDLENAPYNSMVNGECEFRRAADFGYGYDFLVSYGDNEGSEIFINLNEKSEAVLMFYKHMSGGKATITYGDIIQHIDTYSENPQMQNVFLSPSPVVAAAEKIISLFVIALLTLLMYRLISALSKPEYSSEHGMCGERNPSIDIVKITAAFFVVLVHSFREVGYYNTPISGSIMTGLTVIRWLALTCVPLFMIATGYLCIYKSGIARRWSGLIPVLVLYSLITILRDVILNGVLKYSVFSVGGIVNDIIGVTYAWYLEMYVGLVLLMPFLNRLWRTLDNRGKKNLVASMLLLTSLNTVGCDILPNYFSILYPVTYYFIGAFLRENPITMKSWKVAVMLAAVLFFETLFTVTQAAGGIFSWKNFGGEFCNYNAFIVIASAVLLFTLLNRVNVKNAFCKKILSISGRNTLGVYLISEGLTDVFVYPPLQQRYTSPQAFAVVMFPTVIVDFFISLIAAVVVGYIAEKISGAIKKRVLSQNL